MASATVPESHRDLLGSPIVTLATSAADGFPQVTAVWFFVDDGDDVTVSLNSSRQKARNLERDPAATLFFVDPASPYRTLEIRARAEITPDPGYAVADRLKDKYGPGGDVRDNDRPGNRGSPSASSPSRSTPSGSTVG